MKIFKKLALNTDFYNRYISLINDTSNIKTITQVISGITAIAIWYALAENNLQPLLGWWAIIPSSIFSVIVAIAIEIGLRRFLPYGVRCFIQKRWKGLDGAMSAFILPICCALLVATGWTSFKGSYSVIEVVTPDIELQTTKATDSIYIAQTTTNKSVFNSDSITISTSFNKQIEAVTSRYEALAISHNKKSEQYEKRAKRAKGKANKSWLLVLRNRELEKADLQKIKKDSVVADLETAKTAKLLSLLDNRRNDKIVADTSYKSATSKIIASNDNLISENKDLMNSYGLGLGWITVICLLVFIGLTILEEIHKKGSEVEETIVFSQYDILPSIFSRWANYIKESVLGSCHRKLDKWEDNLIPPKLPKKLPPLYYLAEQEQERIEVKGNSQKPAEIKEEEDNEWNTILSDSLNESEPFTNGFSLNQFQPTINNENSHKDYSKETPIINISNGENLTQNRVEIKGFLQSNLNEELAPNNPIKKIKIGHRVDILDLNKLNKRDKEKHKAKERKRIMRFYKNYKKKHGKKPNYRIISNALNISITTVGKYIRELKKEKII